MIMMVHDETPNSYSQVIFLPTKYCLYQPQICGLIKVKLFLCLSNFLLMNFHHLRSTKYGFCTHMGCTYASYNKIEKWIFIIVNWNSKNRLFYYYYSYSWHLLEEKGLPQQVTQYKIQVLLFSRSIPSTWSSRMFLVLAIFQ